MKKIVVFYYFNYSCAFPCGLRRSFDSECSIGESNTEH